MCIRDRLKTAKIKDVGAYFAVSDAKSELSPWDSRLQVSSRGYMMGQAQEKANRLHLKNVTFQQGDVGTLPFTCLLYTSRCV